MSPHPLAGRQAPCDDVAIATVTTEDEDGDSVTLSYSWSVNGDVVPESGHTLDGRVYFDRGDVIWLTVTPSDGVATGEPVMEGPRYVLNTPPAAPTVVIEPEDPGQDLRSKPPRHRPAIRFTQFARQLFALSQRHRCPELGMNQ